MEKLKVLLAEDEKNVSGFLKLELSFENYNVDLAEDGEKAMELFEKNQYHLIILDWMMPKIDGITVCRRIRKKSNVPIIILTARDYLGDKISGLDSGADDYITKPFEIEELFARMRSILRSRCVLDSNILKVADITLDIRRHEVKRNDEIIQLTSTEFNLLHLLMERKGEILSRDEILDEVWNYEYAGQTNLVDVYIRYLRNKIEGNNRRKLIKTARGVGYGIQEE